MCNLSQTFPDVEVAEYEVQTESGEVKIAVLRGGFMQEFPKQYMDDAVRAYTEDSLYNQFVESHLDMPWVRVVIRGINELDYHPLETQRLQ